MDEDEERKGINREKGKKRRKEEGKGAGRRS